MQAINITTATTPSTDGTLVVSIDAARLRRLVADLPRRHRHVITWRYGLNRLTLTRDEIADRLRIEPKLVCRAEREALRALRDHALAFATDGMAA